MRLRGGATERACTGRHALSGQHGEFAFIAHGAGANGKSAFLDVIGQVLGDYAAVGAPGLLEAKAHRGHSTDLADLQGVRLVAVNDLGARAFDEALIKQITGEARIKARRMRQDNVEFHNEATMWISLNHKPIIRGTDYGIWRRVRLIPFETTIPESERDPNFARAVVEEEGAGVLNWLLASYYAAQDVGLEAPAQVMAATDAYRAEMDPLANWVADEVTFARGAWAATADLRQSYEAHARANGGEIVKLTGNKFAAELDRIARQHDAAIEPKTLGGRARGWSGVALVDPTPGV